jgi:hypothetical protein
MHGEQWEFAGIISNGWQRIQRVSGNTMPSGGTQIIFRPSDKSLINWSTFATTEDPDSLRRMRYFSNLYAQFKLGSRLSMITGFDAGIQQISKGANSYHSWLAPVLIARYDFNSIWGWALRGEYYHDGNGVIISVQPNAYEFSTLAISGNLDYRPFSNVALRLEGRYLKATQDVLPFSDGFKDNNLFVTLSLAVKLNGIVKP